MTQRCAVVHSTDGEEGATGLLYAAGVTAGTVGAQGLSLELATIPPGARARAHLHEHHESAAYVISGELVLHFGERLEDQVEAGPGDFLYIPSGVPHLPRNPSATEPAVAVLARSDASVQESVTPLPELDALVP